MPSSCVLTSVYLCDVSTFSVRFHDCRKPMNLYREHYYVSGGTKNIKNIPQEGINHSTFCRFQRRGLRIFLAT